MQTDKVLKEELRVLYLDPPAAEAVCDHTGHSLNIWVIKVHPQSNIPLSKVTTPNISTHYGPRFKHMCQQQPFLYKTAHYIPGSQKTWNNNTIQKYIQFTFRSPIVYNSLNLFKNKAVQSLFGDSHSILTVIPSKIKWKKSENMPPIYNDKDVQHSSKGE